jgi:hypothetical protein
MYCSHYDVVPTPPDTQVDGGRVHLRNETMLISNSADSKVGESIYLSQAGLVDYTLPAPPGRWLFIRQGTTFHLGSGGEDSDFPYDCPAGVVGGPTPEDQSGPQCAELWCVCLQKPWEYTFHFLILRTTDTAP